MNSIDTVSHMAVAGVGLWVAMVHSSTIALYHTESFIHLQVWTVLALGPHMAVAGVGLRVAMVHSSTIALYHTESFIHLQVWTAFALCPTWQWWGWDSGWPWSTPAP